MPTRRIPSAPTATSAATCRDPVGCGKYSAGFGQEAFPGRGEPNVAGGAVEQRHPELTLEPADLLADRRLHDVQSLRRPPEAQLVGDGDEIATAGSSMLPSHPSRPVIAARCNRVLVPACSADGLVTMKAIVNNPGGPAITAVDDPRPGSGEALVAVQAFSVTRGELDLLRTRTSGWRLGQDVAGVVVAPSPRWIRPRRRHPGRGPGRAGGLGRTRRLSPASRLAPLPAEVGTEQAAALPLVGLTALRTLRLAGDLLGRRVLVTGANGGVGRIQIELAAAAGAEVTAVARPQHEKQLLAFGASSVVADPAAADGLYDLVAKNWVGGPSLAAGLGKVAPRGTVVLGSSSTEESADQHLRLLRP